ncbi:DUF4913 domain-containing protein [Streptomyces sp. NPDC094437]|uniref:DUF4913 domain-containing protein n=1 Tax=Streptomyces sp. NPDC094437 TaxID=3366060 RepID=UPI00382A96FC
MADDPEFEVPAGLFERVEEIKAGMAGLKAQLDEVAAAVNSVTASGLSDDAASSGAVEEAEYATDSDGPDTEKEWQYPPFILLLDSPQYDKELRALTEWVEGVLVPGYLAEPSTDARWCHLWWEHPVAVARLHAVWLAWQELTDPASCGYTGPSVWHRDHLDPTMRELRGSTGPFAGCTKGEHQIGHRMPGLVPSAWIQGED